MKSERQDRILEHDWVLGDYADLALRYAKASQCVPALAQVIRPKVAAVDSAAKLADIRRLYLRSRRLDALLAAARTLNFAGLKDAVTDLATTFGERYPRGQQYLDRLGKLEASVAAVLEKAVNREYSELIQLAGFVEQYRQLEAEALLANPGLDFDQLLLIRRVPQGDPRRPHGRGYGVGEYIGTPRQSSKCNPGIEQPFEWDNEIAVLSPVRPEGEITTLYQSEGRRLMTDVDLN